MIDKGNYWIMENTSEEILLNVLKDYRKLNMERLWIIIILKKQERYIKF